MCGGCGGRGSGAERDNIQWGRMRVYTNERDVGWGMDVGDGGMGRVEWMGGLVDVR